VNVEPSRRRRAIESIHPDGGDTRAYFEQLCKAVFRAGMNWNVIESKWPAMTETFRNFEPQAVARFSPDDIEAIAANPDVIRNHSKLEATVENAQVILDLVDELR
jgi:DNA-3-methyladenine glycosylase I